MRHRATSTVRVLDRCARCGARPDLYDVERVFASLPTSNGVRPHELVVCKDCRTDRAALPTHMEQRAMAVDLANPVEVMEFVQRWQSDPTRVLRCAEYFLGAEVYASTLAEVKRKRAEDEERDRERRERWDRERADRLATVYSSESDDGDVDLSEEDDDLPF